MELKALLDVEIPSHRKRIEYVLRNFSFLYKLDLNFVDSYDEVSEEDLLIFYGDDFKNGARGVFIRKSKQAVELFERKKAYDEVLNIATIHFVNLTAPMIPEEFSNFTLPIFFKAGEPVFEIENNRINFDILSCAFYFLSSWDERVKNKKDEIGRFPDEENLLVKLGVSNFPVVNFYFYILKFFIEKNGLEVDKKRWSGKTFAVCLTHDIDVLRKWSAFGVYNEVMNKFIMGREDIQARRERFAKFIYSFMKGKDPYRDGMKKLFEFEKSKNVKSTFFLKSGRTSRYDARYKWDQFFLDFVDELKKSGFEIALHPSFETFDNFELMREEKNKLESLVNLRLDGVRQHYLRYDFKITPSIHNELGFRYDSTLGFNLRQGFRCGYAFPYKIYDIEKDVELEVYEIPLVFMDAVYQYGRSLKKVDEILAELINLAKVVKSFGGVITVLFHNFVYDEFDFENWDFVFEEFLKFAINSDAFAGSCSEILDLFESEQRD